MTVFADMVAKRIITPDLLPIVCDGVLRTTDGKRIPVVRGMLAARSSFFYNLFKPITEPADGDYTTEVPSAALEMYMRYSYTSIVDVQDAESGCYASVITLLQTSRTVRDKSLRNSLLLYLVQSSEHRPER